jgi:hypothetical protein
MPEKDMDDAFGFFEGKCIGCDAFARVNDLGLCEECAGKLERDLIREQDWDYSTLAYDVPPAKREALRKEIVTRYGEKLELIAPRKGTYTKKKHNRSRKRSKSSR